MINDYNDVHLHDERDDGGRQQAEEADFLHDWRISLDERLGVTNTKRLYELLGRVVSAKTIAEVDFWLPETRVEVPLIIDDVRLARELLQ